MWYKKESKLFSILENILQDFASICTIYKKIEEVHNPKILHYVFYHCTKRVHPNCTQRSITLGNLEKKIKSTLDRFEISSEHKDWAIEYLNELNDIEEVDQKTVKDNLVARLNDVDQELRGLLRLRIRRRNVESNLEREKMLKKFVYLRIKKLSTKLLQKLIRDKKNGITKQKKLLILPTLLSTDSLKVIQRENIYTFKAWFEPCYKR